MDIPTCLELLARRWLKKHTALMSQGGKVRGTVISRLFVINMVLLAVQRKERRGGLGLSRIPYCRHGMTQSVQCRVYGPDDREIIF